MSIMTEQEAKTILDKVCKMSKADECTAQLTGSVDGNVSSSTFGQIVRAAPPRLVQLALKYSF